MDSGQWSFLDILTIISFIINLENLKLNEKQSENIMKEMTDKQDDLLLTIIHQNEEIIQLLKEK